jgi:DNA mismatch repair protein MutS
MENITPMLKQYNMIKKQYSDCILFFRLGDFYEMFYHDAKVASKVLDLVLTARSAGKSGKAPMCGLPYHAADSYISRLVKSGYKVAICEQTEDPSKAKGIVKREVIRVITSGTFIDENSSDARYIISICPDKKEWGMAFIVAEGGTIYTSQFKDEKELIETILKIPVYECVFPSEKKEEVAELFKNPFLKIKNIALSECEDYMYNADIAKKALTEHFRVESLKGFGIGDALLSVRSSGGLLEYLRQVNKTPLSHIEKIAVYTSHDYVYVSPAAVYGLELEKLIDVIDRTVTSMGKRKLKFWCYHPLKKTADIIKRQEAVKLLKNESRLREEISDIFKDIQDTEKAISRISCGYTAVKDILVIRKMLESMPAIKEKVNPLYRENELFFVHDVPELREFLSEVVNPEVSPVNYEGKFVKQGYDKELDQLRQIQTEGRSWLKNLQRDEIKKTGINSLKIGYNKVFGYYIEVTKANLKSVPSHFIRKQTLVNSERFITPELKEFEEKVITAEERILKIENSIIEKVKGRILEDASVLYAVSDAIAVIDVLCSLAEAAEENRYVKPEINDGQEIIIEEGRHPVVEKTIEELFISNDTYLDRSKNYFSIITGPNMAGKSTYIRQVALIVIMAQIGSFIPAEKAKIGIADKIFSRIGARDEITKGQSTFMVEMTETAEILNNLSARSLIVLDEIGRGTSTYDGFSLAWAVAEFLQGKKVRTLFATHFHELTALARKYKGVKNYNVAVKENNGEVVFLHKIIPGSTDESYGVYVARVAGIPKPVVERAGEILAKLEFHGALQDKIIGDIQLEPPSLFSESTESPVEKIRKDIDKLEYLKDKIQALDLNNCTPVDLMLKIKEIQEELKNGKS